MPGFNEEEIRAVLHAYGRNEERDSNYDFLRQANLVEHSRIRAKQRRYFEKLLAGAGFNMEELDKIQTQNQTEIRQILQKQKAAVVKRSSSAKEALRYGIDSQRRAIEHLASLREEAPSPCCNPHIVVLDTAALILSTPDLLVGSRTQAAWNNVAKFDAEWSTPYPHNGDDYLDFVFVWENPSDTHTVINVESSLMFNGFGEVFADPIRENSEFTIYTQLLTFEWWNQPPTMVGIDYGFFSQTLYASGGWLGEYKSGRLSINNSMAHQFFLIPPRGTAVFEVRLQISHETSGGFIEVDFSSGDFEVMCPAVVLEVLV